MLKITNTYKAFHILKYVYKDLSTQILLHTHYTHTTLEPNQCREWNRLLPDSSHELYSTHTHRCLVSSTSPTDYPTNLDCHSSPSVPFKLLHSNQTPYLSTCHTMALLSVPDYRVSQCQCQRQPVRYPFNALRPIHTSHSRQEYVPLPFTYTCLEPFLLNNPWVLDLYADTVGISFTPESYPTKGNPVRWIFKYYVV